MKWTAEKIAKLSTKQIKVLRANAAQRGGEEVVRQCDEELARRSPARNVMKVRSSRGDSRPVLGFHFVCPIGKGVKTNPDGSFWTGTWVVDKKLAIGRAENAYVALHAAKSEPSYCQGTIKDWRRSKRESQESKIPYGIDFLAEPFDERCPWNGDGAGEKGYKR
jgi:hypothetical protein